MLNYKVSEYEGDPDEGLVYNGFINRGEGVEDSESEEISETELRHSDTLFRIKELFGKSIQGNILHQDIRRTKAWQEQVQSSGTSSQRTGIEEGEELVFWPT